MRVFINPGHDRKYDKGAPPWNHFHGIHEADVAYAIGKLVEYYLQKAGCDTYLMQSDNLCHDSNYPDRAEAVCYTANDWGADIFVSIHCNSFDGRAHGTEVEAYRSNTEAARLAECIQAQIIDALGTTDRGVKFRHDLIVLNQTDMPAVLVETAFIDQEDDAELLRDRQDDFARAIARGVTDWASGRAT